MIYQLLLFSLAKLFDLFMFISFAQDNRRQSRILNIVIYEIEQIAYCFILADCI